MIEKILNFVLDIKQRQNFYLIKENLDEKINYSEKKFIFSSTSAKEYFLSKWKREITDEDYKWIKISNLEVDWQLTLESIYLYGGFDNNGFYDALVGPPQPDYLSIACEHEFFSDEEERFLKEETVWFCKSAHGMGDGTYGIFHRTKDKYPFDILYLDSGIFFKTNFTLESYYKSMMDSIGVCGWQYFYLDFEEIKSKCADFKLGYWLLYPYTEGLSESPLGRNVTKDTLRIDALVHHMEVCVYLLPKIFPDKNFDYHAQRLADFKAYMVNNPN